MIDSSAQLYHISCPDPKFAAIVVGYAFNLDPVERAKGLCAETLGAALQCAFPP
ncbi:MAG: hypothetical protein U1C74_22125 [Phenylobacterium sp.]|nr:hypothetical protein [Phenylobacterium sp.]